jgi:hypothetical protein
MEQNINWKRKIISWARNKKTFYSTLAVVILLLIVVIIFVNWQGHQAAKKEAVFQAKKRRKPLKRQEKISLGRDNLSF